MTYPTHAAPSIWSGTYWRATLERVISTAAQAGLAYAVSAGTLDVLAFDWSAFAGIAGGGALLSLLKGLAANAITQDGPGLTSAEQVISTPSTAVENPVDEVADDGLEDLH
jgi:hypothetical protein